MLATLTCDLSSAFHPSRVDKWVGLFIGCVLRWCHLVNACEVKAHLIGCWQNLGAVCFWQPMPSGLNLVVAAVLCDSLCVVSLLPCVADCCMSYKPTVCKVERSVLTIIKRRLLLRTSWNIKNCQVFSMHENLKHMLHSFIHHIQ